MNETAFTKFLALVDFDKKAHDLRKKIDVFKQEIDQINQQKKQLQEQLDTEKVASYDARKVVDELELLMKELDEQRARCTKKLEKVNSTKEYKALAHERDAVQKKQHDLEADLVQAWNTLETAQRVYAAHEKQSEAKNTEFDAAGVEKQAQKDSIQQELEQFLIGRPEKEEGIPQEWLQKYATMRSMVENPVVFVDGDSCGACFYPISREDKMRLQRNALLQCKSCYRFLYSTKPSVEKAAE
jgi:predicted  nucleic acid-binding Zn-ribbon protein